jgi:hypothetical protein
VLQQHAPPSLYEGLLDEETAPDIRVHEEGVRGHEEL